MLFRINKPLVHPGTCMIIRAYPESEFLIKRFFSFGRIQSHLHFVAGLHIIFQFLNACLYKRSSDSLPLVLLDVEEIGAVARKRGGGYRRNFRQGETIESFSL